MTEVFHKAEDRGKSDLGWLKSRFSFSFADWYNPERIGFGALRVLNDDVIEPYSGFPMHGHRDMEIITIVTKGEVTHQDNIGNTGRVNSGEVQVMSAGTGVIHSEFNLSKTEKLELFQIWIQSNKHGHIPRYEQKKFTPSKKSEIQLLVSGNESDNALSIHQDAKIFRAHYNKDENLVYNLSDGNKGVYIFIIEGEIDVEGQVLKKRDAIGLSDTGNISLTTITNADFLLIEVPLV